ncbi:hypothetical protein PR048_007915 [Dryococelus australis]|uniref:Uncharacterized protein n=1 Tax=Dryococelus australis TaxID=614101 RepID=A0ABQ9HVS6_9NEOP|nr:hypothetical protein PR048_007915 [Dryococelus australis]
MVIRDSRGVGGGSSRGESHWGLAGSKMGFFFSGPEVGTDSEESIEEGWINMLSPSKQGYSRDNPISRSCATANIPPHIPPRPVRRKARLPALFIVFETKKLWGDKGYIVTRIWCAIAATRKAMNWRAVFSFCCNSTDHHCAQRPTGCKRGGADSYLVQGDGEQERRRSEHDPNHRAQVEAEQGVPELCHLQPPNPHPPPTSPSMQPWLEHPKEGRSSSVAREHNKDAAETQGLENLIVGPQLWGRSSSVVEPPIVGPQLVRARALIVGPQLVKWNRSSSMAREPNSGAAVGQGLEHPIVGSVTKTKHCFYAVCPAETFPNFRIWKSCRTKSLVGRFSRGSPISPALSFRRCSILTSIILIGSQDLDVKTRPNLLTHSVYAV